MASLERQLPLFDSYDELREMPHAAAELRPRSAPRPARRKMDYEQLPKTALIRLLQERDAADRKAGEDGIVMSYTGRTAPWQITRLVKPKLHGLVKKFCVGDEAEQWRNELCDGENLSAMVTLYKHRGQVDLILT